MHRSPRNLLAITGIVLLACAPLGCSDDDPAAPGNTTPADDIAPLVTGFAPADRLTDVPVDEAVVVVFSEAMDTATATGNVTLSTGTISGLDWNAAGTELTIPHADWDEGVAVTVTVGAGLTDAAGNPLPQAFSALFYTYSSTPVMLDTVLPGPAGAMPTNGSPAFLFSAHMNRLSILNQSEVTQGSKVVPTYSVGMLNNDVKTAVFNFDQPLDPLSEYTITIFGTAQAADGTPLGSDVVLTLTTGADADVTGPEILSVVPAIDAVVPTDLAAVTVTFTEPLNTAQVRPASVSALLEMFKAVEPVWNAAGDEMTIYLQRPLPAGVRLFTVFKTGGFYDLAGNPNAETDSLSFTTQGTASLVPVRDDLKTYFGVYDMGTDYQARQNLENISGGSFDRVVKRWGGTAYDEPDLRWGMAWAPEGLLLVSNHEDDGTATFTPGVQFLPPTMLTSWSGTSQAAAGEETLIFAYSCTGEGPFGGRVRLNDSKYLATTYDLEGCYRVTMEYTITPAGSETTAETGEVTISYAPGLGTYEWYDFGEIFVDGQVDETWDEVYTLTGASLDDRYEQVE